MPDGAGLLLVSDDGHFLTGFTPKIGRWSGFGGKLEAGETPWIGAVRETFEELFGCSVPPHVWGFLEETPALQTDDALYFTYPVKISEILKFAPDVCLYYPVRPMSAADLLYGRDIFAENQEVTVLKLVNGCTDVGPGAGLFADEFMDDIRAYFGCIV